MTTTQEKDASLAERDDSVREKDEALETVEDSYREYQDLRNRHDVVKAQLTTFRNELASPTQSFSAARAHVSSGQAAAVKTSRDFEATIKGELSDFRKSFLNQAAREFQRIKK